MSAQYISKVTDIEARNRECLQKMRLDMKSTELAEEERRLSANSCAYARPADEFEVLGCKFRNEGAFGVCVSPLQNLLRLSESAAPRLPGGRPGPRGAQT